MAAKSTEYKMTQKLGKGSFGDIYQGYIVSSNVPVAIKIEPVSCKTPSLF